MEIMGVSRIPPAWRLPEGVDAPLWEYTHTPRLAADEDAYFADHPLFRADEQALDGRFVAAGSLVDLGCGAGRHSIRFACRGFAVTAVDLSRPMLRIVGLKAELAGIELSRVQANLCRLDCFPDHAFDYALSMFSTLGMIRGRQPRRRARWKPSGSCGRAAGLPSMFIISGSTSATAREGSGSAARHGGPSAGAPSSAIGK